MAGVACEVRIYEEEEFEFFWAAVYFGREYVVGSTSHIASQTMDSFVIVSAPTLDFGGEVQNRFLYIWTS